MAAKFVYTDTEVSEIVAKYQAGTALDVLAEVYGKSVPSIRMKLVKFGVYQASKPATKATQVKPVSDKPKLTKKQEVVANRNLFDELYFEYGAAPF